MSKFSDKEFILLNRAKDLYIYTSEAVGNEKVIPRRRRYPTGQRLETMAMEILQKCHLANTIYCDILMGIGLYRAVNWWLRSPNSSNNNNAYNVNTDGSVNNNNVYNGNNCARPALAGKYAEIR